MKIKFLFLIITSLAFNSCRKHEIESKPRSFVKYYDTGITDDILSLSFADKNNGLALAKRGTILKTNDGGKTWTKNNVNHLSLSGLFKIQYFSSNVAYLMDYIALYKSTDAGETWNKIFSEEQNSSSDRDYHFVSDLVGYQLYYNFGILRTTDGGLNWKWIINDEWDQFTNHIVFYDDISCPTENSIFCNITRDGNNLIIKSEDGGVTWQELPINNLPLIKFRNHFYSQNEGFIMGYETLYKTTDGGLNWQYVDSLNLRNIKMVDEKIGLATSYVKNIGKLNLTNNAGISWISSLEETDYGYSDEHEPNPLVIDYQGFSDRTIYLACENGKFGVITFYNLGE